MADAAEERADEQMADGSEIRAEAVVEMKMEDVPAAYLRDALQGKYWADGGEEDEELSLDEGMADLEEWGFRPSNPLERTTYEA